MKNQKYYYKKIRIASITGTFDIDFMLPDDLVKLSGDPIISIPNTEWVVVAIPVREKSSGRFNISTGSDENDED